MNQNLDCLLKTFIHLIEVMAEAAMGVHTHGHRLRKAAYEAAAAYVQMKEVREGLDFLIDHIRSDAEYSCLSKSSALERWLDAAFLPYVNTFGGRSHDIITVVESGVSLRKFLQRSANAILCENRREHALALAKRKVQSLPSRSAQAMDSSPDFTSMPEAEVRKYAAEAWARERDLARLFRKLEYEIALLRKDLEERDKIIAAISAQIRKAAS